MGLKLGKILKGAVSVVDKVALGGVLENKNSDTPDSPKGKIDYSKLVVGIMMSLAVMAFLYLLLTGKITFDEFLEGVDTVKEVGVT